MPAASPKVMPSAATDLTAVGAAIKRRRTELGYSMVEAARTAGVSRVTLHRIERGNASVTIGAYAAVANSLGLAINAIAAPDRHDHNTIQVQGVAPPFTYVELAALIASGDYLRFLIRQLREVVVRSRNESDQSAIDLIHDEPETTGSTGWDAVLGGVASMTGYERVSAATHLAWCFDPSRYVRDALFDPLGSGKYRWLDYLRTPVELRVRNIILPYGNLEGV